MSRVAALELSTVLAVLAGLWSCSVLGGWFPGVALACCAAVILAPLVRGRLPAMPWVPVTGVAALGGLLLPWTVGADLVGMLAGSLLGLQLTRRWGRGSSSDDRASAILSVLMIVLAATVDPSVEVGLSAMLWLVTAVPLGILSHLVRESPDRQRRVSVHLLGASALVAVLAALIFLALPRLRGADLGQTTSDQDAGRIGFHDEVELGEVGTLLDDPTPVLRVTMPANTRPVTHLRGIVLDRFDGRGWLATLPDAEPSATVPDGAIPVRVQAESGAGVVAFAPGPIAHISDSTVEFLPDHAGTWRLQVPPRRLAYTAWITKPAPDVEPSPRWTQLPPDLDPRIAALAAEILPRDLPPLSAAEAVSDWLQREATHTYQPRDTTLEEPLSTFLFERRTGHCEYFSTAAAVLLRSRGISARVINGYAQPEYNAAGGYWLVRQGHAHSWIEVQDRHGIWTRVDPTPGGSRAPVVSAWMAWGDTVQAAWTGRILGYDGSTQIRVLRSAGWFVQSRVTGRTPGDAMPWLGLIFLSTFVLSVAATLVWGLQGLGRRLAGEAPTRPTSPVDRLHRKARKLLLRRGWQIPTNLPPVEAARWVAQDAQEVGACLEELAWMHYRVRFAGEDSAPLVREARERLTRLRTLVRHNAAPTSARR